MKRWAGGAVFLFLITHVLYVTGPGEVIRALSHIPLQALVGVIILVAGNFAAVSFRLQRLIAHFGCQGTFLDALRATVSGFLAGFYLSNIGGTIIGRHIVLRTLSVSAATNTTIRYYELLILVAVSGGLCVAGGVAFYEWTYLAVVANALPLAEIFIVIPAAFVLGFLWFGSPTERLAFSRTATLHSAWRITEICGITLVAQLLNLAAYTVALHYVGAQADVLMLFGAAAMVSFISMVLPSPNGWGVREAAALYIFGVLDIEPVDAVAISITIGLCYTGVVFLGGATLLRNVQTKRT